MRYGREGGADVVTGRTLGERDMRLKDMLKMEKEGKLSTEWETG